MASERADKIIDSLIAHASREGLGEEVSWPQVEAAINDLLDIPTAASDLRMRVKGINNDEVRLTLEDWFNKAADARDNDALKARRPAEKILAPVQSVGLGGAVTVGILIATGALSLPAAAVVGTGLLVVAGASSYGRWKLSEREDDATQDAKHLKKFAKIASM